MDTESEAQRHKKLSEILLVFGSEKLHFWSIINPGKGMHIKCVDSHGWVPPTISHAEHFDEARLTLPDPQVSGINQTCWCALPQQS
jgi:hypothetical protein